MSDTTPQDDHYICNLDNAGIDTRAFEAMLRTSLAEFGLASEDEIYEHIYNQVFRQTNVAPPKPAENDLLCRYLTPIKFHHFIDSRLLIFPSATQFRDRWECSIPTDYNNAIERVLLELSLPSTRWPDYVRIKASEWNVSCWTRLEDYFEDHLMWDAYAGGADGVGITVRYKHLEAHLEKAVEKFDRDGQLQSGLVNYKTLSLLPFNKHRMFRKENEVRFAFRSFQTGATTISIDEIFDSFCVRISPAASRQHRDMVRRLWLRYGGRDCINWPR